MVLFIVVRASYRPFSWSMQGPAALMLFRSMQGPLP